MKPTVTLLAVLLVLVLLPMDGYGEDAGLYLSGHLGGQILTEAENDSATGTFEFAYDPGVVGGAALGYDLGDRYPSIGRGRIELEVAYRKNGLDRMRFMESRLPASGEVTVVSYLLNSIGEYRESPPWIPYVCLGIGYATVTLKDAREAGFAVADDQDGVLAYQLGAGVGLALGTHLFLDLGYRYFATGTLHFTDVTGDGFDSAYRGHNLQGGVRIKF